MKLDYNTDDLNSLKISELKRIADYWLRQYLLSTADRKNNNIYCPLKKRWFPENKTQVSHFIDRARMCTRYHLDNVHLISEQSNVWDAQISMEGFKSKHHYEYELFLGENKVQKLLELEKEICIFARRDYIEIIEKFKKCQTKSIPS